MWRGTPGVKMCVVLAAMGCLALGGLSGCKRRLASDFKAGARAKEFTVVLASDPETFDPSKMSGAPEGRVAMNIFEGLLMPGPTTEGLDDASKLVVPGVAERYEVSADGKTYTFHLRADAKWSDGKALTAEDFVWSWKRVLTPGFPADYASMFWVIKNAKPYNKGKLKDWSQVGIKASPDGRTLTVELEQPTPFFPELVAFYSFFPVPRHVVEKHGDQWTRPEHIVTNGPYHMIEYKPQQHVTLELGPHYWDKKSVSIGHVKMLIIADQNAVVNAYKTGVLHWSGAGLPVAQITNLLTHPDYNREPMLGTYFFRVNVTKPPMNDPRVRQALNLAVDRTTLVEQTMNALYKEAHTFVPELAGYKAKASVKYDIKRAKQLLAEAGYPNGKGFPAVELLYNTSENHKLIAEAVQDMWKRGLNIDVKLVNKEWKTYLQDVDTMSYQVARAGWIGDYNDPMTFLDMFLGDNGNNDTGWDDPKYNAMIAAATSEADAKKRMALLADAEAYLLTQGPIIPIYFYTNNMLIAHRIKGFEAHNRDIHLFKYMSLPEGDPYKKAQ